MKTWKLVSGILSIILFVVVSFQSCAVGIGNTLWETGEVGGSGGIILFGLASFFGFVLAGSYTDLKIWAGWCLINAILAVVAIVKSKKTE